MEDTNKKQGARNPFWQLYVWYLWFKTNTVKINEAKKFEDSKQFLTKTFLKPLGNDHTDTTICKPAYSEIGWTGSWKGTWMCMKWTGNHLYCMQTQNKNSKEIGFTEKKNHMQIPSIVNFLTIPWHSERSLRRSRSCMSHTQRDTGKKWSTPVMANIIVFHTNCNNGDTKSITLP